MLNVDTMMTTTMSEGKGGVLRLWFFAFTLWSCAAKIPCSHVAVRDPVNESCSHSTNKSTRSRKYPMRKVHIMFQRDMYTSSGSLYTQVALK